MRKHAQDPTALLPFPESSPQSSTSTQSSAGTPVATRRAPLRIDQLDLRQMRAARRSEVGLGPVKGAVACVAAEVDLSLAPSPNTRVGAVQQSASADFYLDLVGAVTVMALVLLAAILV